MSELSFGERDRCGLYTLLENDIVQFVIAKDKRDGMMRATQIALLDQSFLKSKEQREIVRISFVFENGIPSSFLFVGSCDEIRSFSWWSDQMYYIESTRPISI